MASRDVCYGAGRPARLLFVRAGLGRGADVTGIRVQICASTPRPAACWSRASVPGSRSPDVLTPSRGYHGVRVQVCASTPRPAARTRMPDTLIDAGILPAATLEIQTVAGFVFRGPPGRRGLRSIGGILPPGVCARWSNREPGVLARLPPHRAGFRPRAHFTVSASRTAHRRATHAVARWSMAHWSVRLSDVGAPPARTPAERSSIARLMRPQDAAGCRAIRRPGGPPRTNPTHIRMTTKVAGRTPASIGVSGNLVRAAGRGVDAQTCSADLANPRVGVSVSRLK